VISGTIIPHSSVFVDAGNAGPHGSMALWGTVVGASCAGVVASTWVTRNAAAFGCPVSHLSIGCALAWGWYPLLAARFIAGLAIGGSSVLGPVYIAEVSPLLDAADSSACFKSTLS